MGNFDSEPNFMKRASREG